MPAPSVQSAETEEALVAAPSAKVSSGGVSSGLPLAQAHPAGSAPLAVPVRWRKVLRDVWGNKTRTVLVVLSIAVGVFAVGMIAISSAVLSREVDTAFAATNPTGAYIHTDPFDEELVQMVERVPGVHAAEGRVSSSVRIQVGADQWRTMIVYGVADSGEMRLDKIRPVAGAWPPGDHELLIERDAMKLGGFRLGDQVVVETSDGKQRTMGVSGTVYDMGNAPASLSGQVYGYVTLDTAEWLGLARDASALRISAGAPFDAARTKQVADAVKDKVEKSGRTVYSVYVTNGRYPASDVLNAVMQVLSVLGLLVLGLSAFLVVNTVSSILAQQRRQIGVMKAIGARKGQITRLYLGLVIAYAVLSLVVALPLGALGARGLYGYIARFLNLDIAHHHAPASVWALELAVGLLAPLLAALVPVVGGLRISAREAMSDAGLAQGGMRQGLTDRLLGRIRGLPRPLMLSLRNTFRRKGRLALTLATLTLAGAIFVGVFTVRSSLIKTEDEALAYWGSDVTLYLARPYPLGQIEREVLRVPGVVAVESWVTTGTTRVHADKTESKSVYLIGAPSDTRMINPILMQGRWILPEDENAVVLNSEVLKDESDVKVGDEVTLKISDRETAWRVVGIVKGVMTGPVAYTNYSYLARVLGMVGRGYSAQVVTALHEPAYQTQVSLALERHLKEQGVRVSYRETLGDIRKTVDMQFGVLVGFLMIMAILLAVVGGLGLMGTMSINILERTREVGVLRAVGAGDGAVRQIVIVEGVLIGILSWFFGALLALPLSRGLGTVVGMTILRSPLNYTFSYGGLALWLGAVIVLAALASVLPANRASRLSVREVLAYE